MEKLRSAPILIHFAFKVTLAVMLSYAAESLLDWPAIHTCVVTCFFVSLGSLGESLHKAALRIAGALIGGALGIGTILLLMPVMTDLGDLLLAVGAVSATRGLGRMRQRADQLRRVADRHRLLPHRPAGLRSHPGHADGPRPRHRHPAWQCHRARRVQHDLAGPRGGSRCGGRWRLAIAKIGELTRLRSRRPAGRSAARSPPCRPALSAADRRRPGVAGECRVRARSRRTHGQPPPDRRQE